LLVHEIGSRDRYSPYARAYIYLWTPSGYGEPEFVQAKGIPYTARTTVIGVGDLNQDGFEDIAVTGIYADVRSDGFSATDGQVYLYSGANLIHGEHSPWKVLNAGSDHSFGLSLAGGKDVNGDGVPDLLVGAPTLAGEGSIGRVFVYFGGATFDSLPDVILEGSADGRQFGYSLALQDLNADGVAEVIVGAPVKSFPHSSIPGYSYVYALAEPLAARAFLRGGHRSIPVGAARDLLQIQIEPVDNAYDNSSVDPASLRLGVVGSAKGMISAIPGKELAQRDTDGNGVVEIGARFSASDLAPLFEGLRGRHEVPVFLEGSTLAGRQIRADFTLTIIGTPSRVMAAGSIVQPNPFNPSGTITFTTIRPGRNTVRIYDVAGRLRRTLFLRNEVAPGEHRARIDGKDEGGTRLASAVYFYRIDSPDGVIRGRFTIAK